MTSAARSSERTAQPRVGRLADGRAIRYYGAAPDAVPPDRRELPPHTSRGGLRYDPLHDECVTIASHRQSRTFLPARSDCPLCPSGDGRLSEIPADQYEVVVFDNRFPSFGGETGGAAEVVCFTSDHTQRFADLPAARARLVVDAWADRTQELSGRADVEQVFVFENRGQEIGVTLHHPHGQIYALPFLAPRTKAALATLRSRPEVVGDIVTAESDGPRVVAENETWVAFVPGFARWPVEVHLYPRRRVPDLAALDEPERDDLAALYLDVLARLDRMYDAPLPYISAWHQAPVRTDRDLWWLRCEIFSIRRAADKLKYLAGAESAMNVFINDVAPEDVAERLRGLGEDR